MPSVSHPSRQLEGFTVVDLSRYLPGPYCTRLLGGMGATVIKVEMPSGDPMRGIAGYDLLNEGKQIVSLDLRAAAGRAALDDMVASADVFVQGFKPSTARALGLDGPALSVRWPRLVHCSISGYAPAGPGADRAGHDLNYQADAGLLAGSPRVPALLIADVTAGMQAACSIVAALLERERTDRGSVLQISLHDAALEWTPFVAPPKLRGDYACYNVYQVSDGSYVALGALEPKFWERFCRWAGRDGWIVEQFAGDPARSRLLEDVAALFRSHDSAYWAEALLPLDCCFSIAKG
jgi:crotonobetainyl-CoA:carnitine CoA-transferase CaiB-like acyl-CoA transferase